MRLDAEARRMVAFAHDPEHYLEPRLGQSPDVTYPAHLVLRFKLPAWETAVKFAYSVDVVDGRGTRHLSAQISVPGVVTQGELNVPGTKEALLTMIDNAARCFFPLTDGIRYQIVASAPIPIVDPRSAPSERNVSYRTVITFHFAVDHGVVDAEAAAGLPEPRKVAIRKVHAALAALSRAEEDREVRDHIDEVTRDLYTRHGEILPFVPRVVVPGTCPKCHQVHALDLDDGECPLPY